MDGFEFNKLAASVLIAGIIAMVVGNIADILYQPNREFKKGYVIEVSGNASNHTNVPEPEVKIDIKTLMSKADSERGKKDIKKCTICHTLNVGEPNRVGPNLWDVLGSLKGSKEGFNYSKALLDKNGNWTYEELLALIKNPRTFLPGTKMAFIGYKNAQDAADVIAYLRTLSPSPKPLP